MREVEGEWESVHVTFGQNKFNRTGGKKFLNAHDEQVGRKRKEEEKGRRNVRTKDDRDISSHEKKGVLLLLYRKGIGSRRVGTKKEGEQGFSLEPDRKSRKSTALTQVEKGAKGMRGEYWQRASRCSKGKRLLSSKRVKRPLTGVQPGREENRGVESNDRRDSGPQRFLSLGWVT